MKIRFFFYLVEEVEKKPVLIVGSEFWIRFNVVTRLTIGFLDWNLLSFFFSSLYVLFLFKMLFHLVSQANRFHVARLRLTRKILIAIRYGTEKCIFFYLFFTSRCECRSSCSACSAGYTSWCSGWSASGDNLARNLIWWWVGKGWRRWCGFWHEFRFRPTHTQIFSTNQRVYMKFATMMANMISAMTPMMIIIFKFCSQNFLFNFPACCSNCDAPC